MGSQLKKQLPSMAQFLNRLLSLKLEQQNKVFQAFSDRLDGCIQKAKDDGTYDMGVECVRAEKIIKISEQVVWTDPRTKAETKLVELKLSQLRNPVTFEAMQKGDWNATRGKRVLGYYRNATSGMVYGFTDAGARTEERSGRIIEQYYKIGTTHREVVPKSSLEERDYGRDIYNRYSDSKPRWIQVDEATAQKSWDVHVAGLSTYVESTLHLLTGALLGIWDRLKGNPRVKRLQTDAGERLLGRVVPDEELSETLTRLGVNGQNAPIRLPDVMKKLDAGTHTFDLANQWKLKRSKVNGEHRYELVGPSYVHAPILAGYGIFFELIDYKGRYFVPTGMRAPEVLARLVADKPVVSMHRVEAA